MQHSDPLRGLRPIPENELDELAPRVGAGGSPVLAYDVYRVGNEVVMEIDAPGVDPSQIVVAVEGRTLVVTVRREWVVGHGVDIVETGREHGVFTRRLFLGERWDLDRLRAEACNGVIVVRAPLVQHPRHRRIDLVPARQEAMEPLTLAEPGEPVLSAQAAADSAA